MAMANSTYHGNDAQQHLLSPALSSPGYYNHASGTSTPKSALRSMTVAGTSEYRGTGLVDFDGLRKAHEQDSVLKSRIRTLRFVSRLISLLLSIAVFIPISLTLHKFLATKNTYHAVPSPSSTPTLRTAWAKDSKTWPTWMYFLVACISVVLNLAIAVGYWVAGTKGGNRAATVASGFSWTVMLGNLVVWCVAAGVYRAEKEEGARPRDLWGWTCSPAARAIQREFAEVDFDRFCDVQSVSWYIGLVQVGAALLTVVIYIFVIMRWSGKKDLKRRQSQMAGQYPSDY